MKQQIGAYEVNAVLQPGLTRRIWILAAVVMALEGFGRAPASAAERAQPDENARRVTHYGELIGSRGPFESYVWYGVPYAKPPVGELRWRAPQAPESWKGVRRAVAMSQPCTQVTESSAPGYSEPAGSIIGQEDCLYLSIWSPRLKKEELAKKQRRLPVMLWIHGGGNMYGHGAEYTGAHLAASQNVIVVSVNYRLNLMGWISHRAFRGEGTTTEDRSGNYGTLDHIQALKWVRENIAGFGGNSDNVTIFGESGGAHDIRALLQSPLAYGLFHHAIVQSAASYQPLSLAHAENFVADAAKGHPLSSNEILLSLLMTDGKAVNLEAGRTAIRNMSDGEIAGYLRHKSYPELLQGIAKAKERNAGVASTEAETLWIGTTIPLLHDDGAVLDSHWHNNVPVMIGSNLDEDRVFMADDPKYVSTVDGVKRIKDRDRYLTLTSYLGKFYKAQGADERADEFRRKGSDVYVYRFDWNDYLSADGQNYAEIYGAAHGTEARFVFGDTDLGREMAFRRRLFDERAGSSYRQLSEAMMSYWAQFAYTGNPDRGRDGNLPQWKPWDTGQFIVLNSPGGGGIRMSSERLTKDLVIAQINRDPQLAAPSVKCRFIGDLRSHFITRLAPSDYLELGAEACKN